MKGPYSRDSLMDEVNRLRQALEDAAAILAPPCSDDGAAAAYRIIRQALRNPAA